MVWKWGRLVRKGRRGAAIPEIMCKIQYLNKKKSLGLKENVYFNLSQHLWEDCSPAAVMDQPAVVWNMVTITVELKSNKSSVLTR